MLVLVASSLAVTAGCAAESTDDEEAGSSSDAITAKAAAAAARVHAAFVAAGANTPGSSSKAVNVYARCETNALKKTSSCAIEMARGSSIRIVDSEARRAEALYRAVDAVKHADALDGGRSIVQASSVWCNDRACYLRAEPASPEVAIAKWKESAIRAALVGVNAVGAHDLECIERTHTPDRGGEALSADPFVGLKTYDCSFTDINGEPAGLSDDAAARDKPLAAAIVGALGAAGIKSSGAPWASVIEANVSCQRTGATVTCSRLEGVVTCAPGTSRQLCWGTYQCMSAGQRC